MSSREQILQAIRQNKPVIEDLPSVPVFQLEKEDHLPRFREMLEKVGGTVIEIEDLGNLPEAIRKEYPDKKQIGCHVPELSFGDVQLEKVTDPRDLKDLDLVVFAGEFGVAENAAIWLSDEHLVHRAAPFITQHLALVLSKKNLIGTMHEAYQHLGTSLNGYGVFIAGPSKTADIEQSLVIGAHGARSLVVFLTE